eukprot:jgi/Bigna1/127316/aug1.4_g2024
MFRANDWQEGRAVDGSFYWYSPGLHKYAWAVPEELKTQADRQKEAGEWFWVDHPTKGYVPAKKGRGGYTAMNGDSISVRKDAGKPIRLNWLDLVNSENDLVMLEDVNPAIILFHIKQRYHTNQIYSYVGPILISCNPYKILPLYTPNILNDYMKRDNRYLEPHVYAVANSAFRELVTNAKSQSIVISGESGAGKTECTKQALQFLAEIAESATNIEQMILMANPVLEAFGNAKTVRNDNSSRFGKYLEVFFDHRNAITGAMTTNYLLEKSRVCFQAEGERNYHVFYQLVRGATAEMRRKFRLTDIRKYQYLNQSGCSTVEGVPDEDVFHNELLPSMLELNFSQAEIDSIFQIVAGVLTLVRTGGNINFKDVGERKCKVTNSSDVSSAAALLEVDSKALNQVVTTTKLKVTGQAPITVTLSAQQATSARDALAKFAYEKLFDWLVEKVNLVVKAKKKARYSIGILDIFGFEIFEHNSFEQLCINFTNEKLQQFFNFHTFKQEEKCYQEEGIRYAKVPYIDNQPVLDLIEKRPRAIIPMIDEELIVPRGSDKTLINKLHDKLGKSKYYQQERKGNEYFTVMHYAGAVTYDSRGFLEKDRDRLNDEAQGLLSKTKSKFLARLFPKEKRTIGTQAKKSTLGYRFTKQLNALMKTLHGTEPHYIRCIKPNPHKAPLEFYGRMSFDQLRNSGVFEAVKIRKAGFPFRFTHREFFRRFKCTMPEMKRRWGRDAIANSCRYDNDDDGDFVLYRTPEHRVMEGHRQVAVDRIVRYIQKIAKGFIARCLYRRMRAIIPVLERALASRNTETLKAALAKADTVGFEMKLMRDARWMLHVFEEEERIEKLLHSYLRCDPEEVFGELAELLKTADEIGLDSDTVKQARRMFAQARRVRDKIDEDGKRAIESLKVAELKNVLDRANALKYPHRSPTIEKIISLIYDTSKDDFVKMQLKASVAQGDRERIVATTIKLREISLGKQTGMFAFRRFSLLIAPEEWAAKKLFCFDQKSLAASMLVHTQQPIHHCLIRRFVDKAAKASARLMFKNILGFMGDRQYQAGQEYYLAQQIASACIQKEELRTEVYCQMMKQLSQNPKLESVRKGWQLLLVCVSSFPPTPSVENFLEVFIRQRAPKDQKEGLLSAMHRKMYDTKEAGFGAQLDVPTVERISRILLQAGHVRHQSFCAGYNTSIDVLDEMKRKGVQQVDNAIVLDENGDPVATPSALATTSTGEQQPSSSSRNPYYEAKKAASGSSNSSRRPKPSKPKPKPPIKNRPSLPPNWKSAEDPESGDIYYYNTISNESTWDKPSY